MNNSELRFASSGMSDRYKYTTKNDKKELLKWLSDGHSYQYFVTLTLKQALCNDQGVFINITREECSRTAWLLRDRLLKRLIPPASIRNGRKLGFLAFIEGGTDGGL